MNTTPKGERTHIAIFGRRNAGKSSLINALTNQSLSIVSEVAGTTTDPVYKAMELLPLGPIMLIDTPGMDDVGALGQERVKKAEQVLISTDLALLVVDGSQAFENYSFELDLIHKIKEKNIPLITVWNKSDALHQKHQTDQSLAFYQEYVDLAVSAQTNYHIHELKELMASKFPELAVQKPLVRDLVRPNDCIILVIPIDSAAPKGRLILPQQQVIRDILEVGGIPVLCRDTELTQTLDKLSEDPRLVITDSQAFATVSKLVPTHIPLTSFSILFARYKGNLDLQVRGIDALKQLKDGDKILISEGCTHHRQCDDIGTVKIPRWIQEYTKKEIQIETSSGTHFPSDLSSYKMVVHCGGCTLKPQEMAARIQACTQAGVPVVNYGTLIAEVTGVLQRSLRPFVELLD